MILTCHLLTGAAIASKIHYPPLALVLAFLSHYFFDLFPHRAYPIENIKKSCWKKSFFDFKKVFLDIALGVLLIFLFSKHGLIIFAAASLAVLPDGFTLLSIIFPNNRLLAKYHCFHGAVNNNFGEHKKIPLYWGILSQILVSLMAIFLLR